jgi:Ca2+-transporting ATPase
MPNPAEKEPPREKWHTKSVEKTLTDLRVDYAQGLPSSEHRARLVAYGKNELPAKPDDPLLLIFFKQFKSPLIYLLICAALVMISMGKTTDAGIVTAVLVFNAIVGTIQTGRAQNTLKALQKITKTNAVVRRAGATVVVEDAEVVPGDIIELSEGDKVPADARLIEVKNLRVNESALTGESNPVGKHADVLAKADLQPADQRNLIFKGTFVVGGAATAVVIATGAATVIGGISKKIEDIDTEIPLQKNVRRLSQLIVVVVLAVSAFIFTIGALTGKELGVMFTLAVAVIVAAVPEGLPIVMTVLLASGVWRMSKRHVLIKRMEAVEALGETKVIAVDKTGTITKNELALSAAFIGGEAYEIAGVGYEPNGSVRQGGKDVTKSPGATLHFAAATAALCSNAAVLRDEETGLFAVRGDPTEAALLVFAEKLGQTKEKLRERYELKAELPFDSTLRFHALLYQEEGRAAPQLLVAGAPESLLARATKIHWQGEVVPLTDRERAALAKTLEEMASQALRVIALAERPDFYGALTPEAVTGLTIIGLVGLKDGLRSEVAGALARTRAAGIKVIMITGDHKQTAAAIAREADILRDGDTILTDEDITSLDEAGLARALGFATVFARITPEHKLKIVQAFRQRGDVVAMTGDGVNDALSLVAADLGVAMGRRGTEVAKEAADIVLLDDNFGNIVSAVEEGRGIFLNMKKVLLFLLSSAVGEIMIIAIAIMLVIPSPVLAAQLIWINLVTNGFLDMGLALEPKERGLLRRHFVKPRTFLIDGWMAQRMIIMSAVMTAGALIPFMLYHEEDLAKAMTIAVTTMVVAQWFKAWTCRAHYDSIFSLSFFSNKFLIAATILVISLHILALHTTFLQQLLSLTPLSLFDWLLVIGIGSLTLIADEARKWFYRRFEASPAERAAMAS